MKKQIVITLILLAATVYVTVVYFKNLNPPGMRTSRVMQVIPDDASLIFEFNNDKGFFDIFNNNPLFIAVTGKQTLAELDTVNQLLLHEPALANFFSNQNIFISVHPTNTNKVDLLLTMSAANGFDIKLLEQLAKNPGSGLLVTPLRIKDIQGYSIYFISLKKRFYVISRDNSIFSGSFSQEVINRCLKYKYVKNKTTFITLSEQQNANALASLYINYKQLSPLFSQLFQNKNTDVLKELSSLPAFGALNLNYRNEALMFNGTTRMQEEAGPAYLDIFANQQPVANHLKDIFPATLAYGTNFSVSNASLFASNLSSLLEKDGVKRDRDKLLTKIKAETGVAIRKEMYELMGNEFAVLTTRYFEKFAIISLKNGLKAKTLLTAISTMNDENSGQLNYDKVPLYLFGDAFNAFKKPYFAVTDNYLILANSIGELKSYNETYNNRKFLSKNDQYNRFDNLLSGQSNVSFFLSIKNSMPIFERDMYPAIYHIIKNNEPGWKDFYGISIQFAAADKNFYTNLCIKLNADSSAEKPIK